MSVPGGLPRGWLGDTLAMYGRVFRRGATLAVRNWPIGLLVVPYSALYVQIAMLVLRLMGPATIGAPLGLVGGFLLYLATAAFASSALALVGEVVRTGRVRMADVPRSFGAYFSDLLTVFFLFWALRLIAEIVLAPLGFLKIVFQLAVFVFLNAVPELVYLGRHGGTELFAESYRFIGDNWIEWFPANVLLVGCVVLVVGLPGDPYGIVQGALLGIVLYFAMIVRGLLFLELSTSSRRAREFKRRAAG